MSRARRAAERRGRAAEWLVLIYLMLKGYRILARRARTPYGEVDLAALRAGLLVFVEVKARASRAEGLEAVRFAQRERLAMAAQTLAARWRLSRLRQRFDVVVVRPWGRVDHIRDAWREERVRSN